MPRVDIWDVAKAKAAPAVDAGYERGFAEKCVVVGGRGGT
jgi:hypothetical protein